MSMEIDIPVTAAARRDMEANREEALDDDGLPRRTGTVWTASAHIITAVIGSGVLSLAWAMAQLGWAAGSVSLVLFSVITLYTSSLLADCYRTGDPCNGTRNYTYMAAVKSNLGGTKLWLCGLSQYVNLFGVSIGYTITASLSLAAIVKSNCYHWKGREADCSVPTSLFMVGFGMVQIFMSQLQNFHKLWWLSIVAALMSFCYSFIGVGLSAKSVISGEIGETSITGTVVGVDVTAAEKIWKSFQALGNIAFAYSYSLILIEIQDTLRSPAENKVMKRATVVGVAVTTVFYILCGCLGYVAFGNKAPGNMLTGFGFYEPFWLIDIANICIVVHLLGAYQVFSQPLFAVIELRIAQWFPNSNLLNHERPIVINNRLGFSVNGFRLAWRTGFVITSTTLAIIMPFFNEVLAFLGALGFWPLTVYFPIEMYIAQKGVARFSTEWVFLKCLSFVCFLISVIAACASIQGVIASLKHFSPFHTRF
ncbi:amino acid permease 8-like [Zingiber officinale]|uniref:amino acid permease 8-like n=1 Tax=Zingiber officinale TaxID=94328 RepID=UPI001C4CBEFC|nr:amino acid permease 8-like [Zingiber officinale]